MGNSDTVRAFVGAWEARDMDAILGHMTPDARYVNVGLADVSGHNAIRAIVGSLLASSRQVVWTIHHLAESANGTVLTERTDVFEMADRTLTIPVMGVFEFDGSKISAWRDYFDVSGFQQQMSRTGGG